MLVRTHTHTLQVAHVRTVQAHVLCADTAPHTLSMCDIEPHMYTAATTQMTQSDESARGGELCAYKHTHTHSS